MYQKADHLYKINTKLLRGNKLWDVLFKNYFANNNNNNSMSEIAYPLFVVYLENARLQENPSSIDLSDKQYNPT